MKGALPGSTPCAALVDALAFAGFGFDADALLAAAHRNPEQDLAFHRVVRVLLVNQRPDVDVAFQLVVAGLRRPRRSVGGVRTLSRPAPTCGGTL